MLDIQFCGAARTVTGSLYLLRYTAPDGGKFNCAIDAGLFQVGNQVNLFKVNSYLLFNPRELDALILTHAHLDHCGRIPYLIKRGFGGKIYATEATKQISEVVMLDAAHLNTDEYSKPDYYFPVKGLRKQELIQDLESFKVNELGKRVLPTKPTSENLGLYSETEVEEAMRRFKVYQYHQKFLIHPNLEVEFYDAGHILGSAYVIITEKTTGRKIAFSGDLGNTDKPIIEDPEMPKSLPSLTHIFIETTYGNRRHGIRNPKESLRKIVLRTIRRNGKVLIPSFSVERAQELIYYLVELMREGKIPKTSIFLDSPMAAKVLKICLEHPELYDENMRVKIKEKAHPLIYKNLRVLSTAQESKTLNNLKGPCIIIAGSGMLNGGRMLKHLHYHLENPKNTLLFVGYQAEGTLGRKILDGAKTIEVEGKELEVKVNIELISEFSGHADQLTLKHWVENLIYQSYESPPTVFLMHGEKASALEFGRQLEYGFQGRVKTYWPHFGEKVVLWQ